jgi:uncharacterized damage-inducible protein DinB
MNTAQELARHIRGVYLGGNWTAVNLRDVLSDVTINEANDESLGVKSILTLACHVHYFTKAQLRVLRGEDLDANDALSFNHPDIDDEQAWASYLQTMWNDAEAYAQAVEQLPSGTLDTQFVDARYGTYRSNIVGNIEHAHYHLGQISLLRTMLRSRTA